MTIAVGMLIPGTTDLVIAADTQETYQEAKMEGQKIMTLTVESNSRHPLGCVVFTGSGSAGYLDSLGQAILKTFLDSEAVDYDLKVEFEKTITRFYRRHVIQFGESWIRDEQLAVSTLIAYQRGEGHHGLYANMLTAVRETRFSAVGSGQIIALGLLNRLRQPGTTHEAALRLAAYAVYRAKEHDPYCGKETDLILLSGNRQQAVSTKVIHQWEHSFAKMDHALTIDMSIALGIGLAGQIGNAIGKGALRKLPHFEPSGIQPGIQSNPTNSSSDQT